MHDVLPVILFGHGNPMNAMQHNCYNEGWRKIGKQLRKPDAILSIFAHWFVPGTGVTVSTAPSTIHDFGGFPQDLGFSRLRRPVRARLDSGAIAV